ncbi:methyltransferase [Actinocorallia aurantiaca]|uniref:Protein-S-isoprenylcysteine O-methyltransferase Ste14 n=1 Tax=Actinocorallia aurantiaca TaxID=46204 RepID=A0ABN3UC99_9ACTN
MTDPALVRGVGLFVPILITAAMLRHRPPGRAETAALVLGVCWNALALSLVNLLALRAGWWSFAAEGGTVAGMPVDLLLGWAVLWGGVAVLALRHNLPLPLVAGLAVWIDLAVMPLGGPVLILGDSWLTGEALAVAVSLVPGLLLARWTLEDRRLVARAVSQAVLATGLMVVLPVLPSRVLDHPGWALGLVAQLLLVPAALSAAAVHEFACSGRGTPLPYDPPIRLVTTGPYAYVRNPMQLGMTLTYLLLALLDPVFLLGAVVAVSYGLGLAAWHEDAQLRVLHGPEWSRYRSSVRPWLPTIRPYPGIPPAAIWIANDCDRCDPVASWIRRRSPVALTVLPAETHPSGLRRMTYERADGLRAEGVAAWARATGHLALGWALLGWILLLPGLSHFAQLCADAFGAGPSLEPARNPALRGSVRRVPASGDDVRAQRGEGGGDLADGLLGDAQGREGGGEVADDGVEVPALEVQARVRGTEVAALVQFRAAQGGGDERPLVGSEAGEVRPGEETLELRVAQDSHVEVVDRGADRRRPSDLVVNAHSHPASRRSRPSDRT